MELVMLCMGRSRYSPENSSSTIRRSHRRRGPHTSYSDVFHCPNSASLRTSRNVGCRGETSGCHNFRHVDATTTASDSCGKSPAYSKVSNYIFIFHTRWHNPAAFSFYLNHAALFSTWLNYLLAYNYMLPTSQENTAISYCYYVHYCYFPRNTLQASVKVITHHTH